MNDHQSVDRGARAEALLNNALFKDAFDEMRSAIVNRMEQLDFNDKDEAAQLLMCLKLLRTVRAKFEQAVRDGKISAFRLDEEQRKQKDSDNGK